MTSENISRHRTEPVRIIDMSIGPGDPRPSVDAPLVIRARLDPAPDVSEHQWWAEQFSERVKVRSWTGSSRDGLVAVDVEAPADQVEAVARRLLAAVDEANAAYPQRYPAWRREHDEQIAEERIQQQRYFAARQAIVDRVMEEYHSNQ